MKNISIMRGYAGLQAFLPSTSKNVQEIAPTNKVLVAGDAKEIVADRPRVLTQRNARSARRAAH
ncbi:MAG: hypothetical protein AAGL99_08595 [Pseudomonadota bacterium]